MRRQIGLALALAAAIVGSAQAALAGAFEVAPTTIELSPRTRTAVVRITNRGDHAVTIQARPYDWRQAGGKDILTPSTALAVSPATARLPPGGRQVVRLVERESAAGAPEQAHRLLVRELTSADAVAAGQVRVLLQFSLPVFRPSRIPGAASLSWDARVSGDKLILTAANASPRHAKLANLAVVDAGGGRAEVVPIAYVLPGSSRSWRVPAGPFERGGDMTLQAEDGVTGRPMTWSLKVRPKDDGRPAR